MSNRIRELEEEIIKHKQAYYLGKPTISDAQYDNLETELRKLSPDNPILQIVGSVDAKGNITHVIPMLSAEKKKDVDEIIRWASSFEIVYGLKIDGLSLEIEYMDGNLLQASTRGDGIKGKDVTAQAFYIVNIPKKISLKGHIIVRGEAYIPLNKFKSSGDFISARNLATGTLQSLDPTLTAKRGVMFSAWDLLLDRDIKITEKIKILTNEGFQTADISSIGVGAINDIFIDITTNRSSYNFEMDGLVFKYNDPVARQKAGATSHHPRWMVALKFPSGGALTIIRKIDWQVGRTSRLTPVAIFDPVVLSGATITKATLHNARFVLDKDIAVGDTVELVRSGDVIPKITQLVSKGKCTLVEIPTLCPVCKGPIQSDGTNIWCMNKNCGDIIFQNILHFVKTLKIELLGPSTLRKLWEANLIKQPADLYKISKMEYRNLFGVNGIKIFEQLQSRKNLPLHYFLASLGISSVSLENAKILTVRFKTWDALRRAKSADIMSIKGLGQTVAKNLIYALADTSLYQPLFDVGITIKPYVEKSPQKKLIPEPTRQASPIKGMKIYITGSVTGYTKEQLQALVEDYGGIWKGMSKSLDLLVVGESGAGWKKLEEAKEWGLKTMDSDAFLKWMGVR